MATVAFGEGPAINVGSQEVVVPTSNGTLYLNQRPVVSVNESRRVIVRRAVRLDRPIGLNDVVAGTVHADITVTPALRTSHKRTHAASRCPGLTSNRRM